MGLDLRDLIRNIHPLHHFAEYRIAKVALAMVEEGVIRHVDEELTGGAILIGGTRHRDGAAGVAQAVVCFILDRRD